MLTTKDIHQLMYVWSQSVKTQRYAKYLHINLQLILVLAKVLLLPNFTFTQITRPMASFIFVSAKKTPESLPTTRFVALKPAPF